MANPASAEITSVISICPASRTMWGMIEPLMLIRSAYPCAAPQLGESFGERHRESQEGRSRILFECSRPKSQLVQARAECSDMHHILGTGWRSGFACGGSHLVEQWSRRYDARPPFPFLGRTQLARGRRNVKGRYLASFPPN